MGIVNANGECYESAAKFFSCWKRPIMKSKSTTAPRSEMPALDVGEMLESLADQIRAWRGRHSMTQADLAVKSGISVSFISMIERAERSPSYETLYAIARALDIQEKHRADLLIIVMSATLNAGHWICR